MNKYKRSTPVRVHVSVRQQTPKEEAIFRRTLNSVLGEWVRQIIKSRSQSYEEKRPEGEEVREPAAG
jgi:hypothetical protein